jgi:transcriptional regulator with XRE-family HTH domain
MASFGEYIAARRKALKLTRKDMAAQIKKGDGTHISNTYLLDVEKGRCRPPSDQMIEQIGAILNVPVEVLYFHAERMPADLKQDEAPEERIVAAFQAFRREIRASSGKKKKRS